jgi:hypothetical protein
MTISQAARMIGELFESVDMAGEGGGEMEGNRKQKVWYCYQGLRMTTPKLIAFAIAEIPLVFRKASSNLPKATSL